MSFTTGLPPADWYREDNSSLPGITTLIFKKCSWPELADPHVSLHEVTPIYEVMVKNILANSENTKDDSTLCDRNPEQLSTLARQWTKRGNPVSNFQFLVAAEGKPVGIAGYSWIGRKDPYSYNIYGTPLTGAAGVVINPEERRKGYGSMALKTVVDYGLRILGLELVVLHGLKKNTALVKMMEDEFPVPILSQPDYFGNDCRWAITRDFWHEWLRTDASIRYQATTHIIAQQQTYGQSQGPSA